MAGGERSVRAQYRSCGVGDWIGHGAIDRPQCFASHGWGRGYVPGDVPVFAATRLIRLGKHEISKLAAIHKKPLVLWAFSQKILNQFRVARRCSGRAEMRRDRYRPVWLRDISGKTSKTYGVRKFVG